ncbi:phage portal protein [Bacillus sp. B-jedd]|uniref:phage portal protein n=1 Tax=Bacillus sp. B-jedd TaxID=1476857 RepID=UPI0005157234|nr:phage portal protein [Bacillus sp. B-jedd]CEG28087.1 HK97 family phage portal protein [Bacillus sp. B-jedd]
MKEIGFLDTLFKRNSELGFMFDVELLKDTRKRLHMKKLAIDTCASFLGRTISQAEFRVKSGKNYVKDDLYYKLNVRPNKNMTASTFWQTVIEKLIYDNECLIIQSDDLDLLIADSFDHNQYAVWEDTFSKVVVKDYEFKRSFKQSEVFHLRYKNENLMPLIDGLFDDYGELFGRILSAQKRKNQIRGTVDMDMIGAKSEAQIAKLQEFIDNMYKAISEKDVAIVPQQKGIKYEEKNNNTGSGNGPTVEEINKVTDGFLDQVAKAIGIPPGLLHGEMADVEKQTKNYMLFCVNPLLKKIRDEGNFKFFEPEDYLNGVCLEVKPLSYQTIFDLATSIDKLIASGGWNRNEIRVMAGDDPVDDPELDKYVITKNYQEVGTTEGGENE